MKKEETTRDYSYLKKDLLKVGIISGVLIICLLVLSFLDLKTNFVSRLAEKIMDILIK